MAITLNPIQGHIRQPKMAFPFRLKTLSHFSSIPKSLFLRSFSFSISRTPYPLQYDLISYKPVNPSSGRSKTQKPKSFENFPEKETGPSLGEPHHLYLASKSKRKYYKKRRKRMYGSETDDEGSRDDEYVELKPEVVEMPTYHAREEELYFHDAFAFPWEKDKHYRMVYQLEKKFFPGQGMDQAFVDPNKTSTNQNQEKVKRENGLLGKSKNKKKNEIFEVGHGDKGISDDLDKKLVFFEESGDFKKDSKSGGKVDVTEKKVEEFFKCLKKVPNAGESLIGEPYFLSRTSELPPRWDGPFGTVVLIDKPKGWTSFTVCGKLRRLVKVQKVGHAGTLDPMATGLLIVCIGKATKQVERYQDMIKVYSGIFRLGEATSTWDAESPVIQREPWEHIKDEDIRKAVASFSGEIWQVPPMFSAIKVGGEKLYEKARRGETMELSPRRISIFEFDIERSLDDRQNLIFKVTCSKGTYIRSLCADLGRALGSCAHLIALRRDQIGQYSADNAWNFDELQDQITKNYL
ncbi:hypothetical protein AMTRI_Chr06g176500 [Amborella trichopoda]